MAGMKRAVSSTLIVTPGVTGGFTGTPAGAGGPRFPVLGIKLVIIRTQRLSLCDEVWAGSVTGFPHLFAVLPTNVEA